MRVDCLRHGETASTLNERFNGILDESITSAETQRLQHVNFDTKPYDAIFCSPLRRCTETAEALGIYQWIREDRLIERNLGIFQGLAPNECETKFPQEFKSFRKLDNSYHMPEGESRSDHLVRIKSWLTDAIEYRHVLAITHGGTIDFLYRMAKALPIHGGEKVFAGDNASLSRFDVEWPEVKLVSYSDPI